MAEVKKGDDYLQEHIFTDRDMNNQLSRFVMMISFKAHCNIGVTLSRITFRRASKPRGQLRNAATFTKRMRLVTSSSRKWMRSSVAGH